MLALGLIRVIVYFCNQSKYRKTSLKNYSGNVGSGENIQGNTNQGLGLGKNIQSDTKSKASSQVSQGNESLDLKSKIIVGV